MSINLVTYANQTVTPTNDAIIYEKAVDQNGIFYGCNITVSGNNVNITGGYGIVCGREFVIESESIPVTLAPSVPLDGRLYVRLDLADADNPIQLLTAQGGTLPALVQDSNVNFVNGVWEMELATFTVGVSALSDCVETFETIVGAKTDYIVEQGTSGVWKYRKWASGIAECWYANSFTINFETQIVSSLRTSSTINEVALPSFLLSVTELNTSGYNADTTGWPTLVTGAKNGSNIRLSYMAWIGAGNSTINANVYVKGTWK